MSSERFLIPLIAMFLATPAAAQDELGGAGDVLTPDTRTQATEFDHIEIDERTIQIVQRLDHANYMVRESAMDELRMTRLLRDQLCAVLAREPLSAEQRYRLLQIVHEEIVEAPRGALGIRKQWLQTDLNKPGEDKVQALLPDLPARDVLRIDDRIFKVDGLSLMGAEDLITYVQTLRPGDIVELDIKRPVEDDDGRRILDEENQQVFQEMKVELELGSAAKLDQPTRPSQVERERLYDVTTIVNRFGPRPRRLTR